MSEDAGGGRVLVVAPSDPDAPGSFSRGVADPGSEASEHDPPADDGGADAPGVGDSDAGGDDTDPDVGAGAPPDDGPDRGSDPEALADGIAARLPVEVVLKNERTAAEYLAELGPTIDCVVVLGGNTGPLGGLADDVSIPAVVCERPVVEAGAEDASATIPVAMVAERVRSVVREARSRSDLQDRNTRLTVLGCYARDITGCETVDDVLDRTLEAATDALAFDYCVVLLVDGDRLVPRASVLPDPELSSVDVTEGIAGRTLETGEGEIVSDIQSDPDAVVEHDDLHALLSVPVGSRGVLQIASRSHDAFDDRDKEFAEILSGYTAEALARLEREVTLRAERDRLHALYTELPVPVVSVEQRNGETTVTGVNDAYEAVFGRNPAGEPLPTVVSTQTEHDQYEAALDGGAVSRGTVVRSVASHETDVALTVIPVAPPGGSGSAFGVYQPDDGDGDGHG